MAIYKSDIVDVNLETGSIHRSFMKHTIGTADQAADRIGIRAFRDGVPEDLSGASCYGYFRNSQGDNIALTSYGTISGNEAYVTLPQACYNYEGNFTLTIKLLVSGATSTVRIVDGVVDNTNTGSAVAPTSAVPSYSEILSQYDDMVAATAVANGAIATTFNAATVYPAGSYVINNGALYRITADHAANVTWANTSKVATNFGAEVSDLKSALSEKPLADFSPILSIVEGSSVKASTGEIQENANLARSDYTDTQGATSFALVGYNPTNYCIYTKDKEYINGASSPGQSAINLPATAKYIIFTAAIGHVYDIKLHLYNANTVISKIKDDIAKIESYDPSGMSFNTNDSIVADYTPTFGVVEGEQVNSSTGVISSNANLGRSDYIPLRNAGTVSFSGQNVTNYVFFDINKAYVTGGTSPSTDILNVPSTAKYIMYTSQLSRLYGVVVHLYNAYGYMREALPWCRKKKINWIGDSIVAGEDFDEKVCGVLDLIKANEYGIGGSTIALNGDGTDTRNAICVRYADMSNDADIIAVSAGTNDFEYAWCPIGTINDPDDGTSNTTFYGALKTLCKGLIDKYPQKVVFFTTPIKRAQAFENGNGGEYTPDNQMLTPFSKNKYGKTLMDYADIIKEVCGYYSIPVLDLNRESMLNPHIASQQDLFDSAYTHPNTTGQKIMARRVAGWIAQLEYLIPGLS